MNYMGGKFKQSREIAPIINQCIKDNLLVNYYEPFCGGLNVLDKIECPNLFANDIDEDLIAFYSFIHNGGSPFSDVSREMYYEIKASKDCVARGNVKYLASFGGKPWGGYGWRNDSNKSQYAAALSNFKKQIPIIRRTNFSCKNYLNLVFEPNSFIYLDPPYANTTQYTATINYQDFYEWVIRISQQNYVIISEYSMPAQFTCFKEIEHKKSLKKPIDGEERTRVNDNLYYCDGLFKNWYENEEE